MPRPSGLKNSADRGRAELAKVARTRSAGLPRTRRRRKTKTRDRLGLPLLGKRAGRKNERPAASGPANRTVQCLPPRPRRAITMRDAHARARDPLSPLLPTIVLSSLGPARRRAIRWIPVSPPGPLAHRQLAAAATHNLGRLSRRAAARGGCRRGRRSLARACNS